MPTWRRTRFWSTFVPVTRCPRMLIRPALMGSSRLMQRSRVDFPEPDAPIRQMTSCVATDRLMPLSTSLASKDLCRSSITMAWAAGAEGAPAASISDRLMSSPRPVAGGGRGRSAGR